MLSGRNTARCPVTVVGGFLGAGKTTLLNRLLAGARGRYAVLVNDFGAVNVDAGLIAAHEGETLRLTNGCICCSLADGFLDSLLRVLGEKVPFDHIVIEASGVGDPRAIADIALVEPDLSLRGIVVLADAERLPALLADSRLADTVARQIEGADLLVLNKRDLVDEAGFAAARAAAANLRADLPAVPATGADVPDAVLALDAPHHAAPRCAAEVPARHDAVFRPVLYRRQGAFDGERLHRALDALPPSLLRLKGAARLAGDPSPKLLQLVGRRRTLQPAVAPGPWPIELVGVALDDIGAELAARLDAALTLPAPPDAKEHACA